jgi:hypothetical protein
MAIDPETLEIVDSVRRAAYRSALLLDNKTRSELIEKHKKGEKKMPKTYKNETKKRAQLRVDPEILERIDALAVKADMTRTRLIENILRECAASLELSQRIGLFQTSLIIRDMGQTLTEWAKGLRTKKPEALASGK